MPVAAARAGTLPAPAAMRKKVLSGRHPPYGVSLLLMNRNLIHFLEDIPARSVITASSALDMYFSHPEGRVLHVSTEADLIELARHLGAVEYPGIEGVDAMLATDEGYVLFTCVDSVLSRPRSLFTVADLAYEPAAWKYLDPTGMYGDLRAKLLRVSDGVVF